MGTREGLSPERRHSTRRMDDAQALVIFALFSLVLIGALALSVDAGMLLSERRQVQAAADAAAMAAAKAALDSKSGSEIIGTGQSYGAFNAGVPASNVTVNRPPTSGPHAGDNNYVQVTVTKDVQRYFVNAVYTGDWSVSARSVAGIETVPRPYALVALDPTGYGLVDGGGAKLTITGGAGAMSNYKVDINGSSEWISPDAPLDANKQISVGGSSVLDANPVRPNQPLITDPYASVPEPTSSECGPNRPDPKIKESTPSPITLQPGNYTEGLDIQGQGKTIVFQSGVYCFGKDLKVTGGTNGNTLTGTDVVLYFKATGMFNVDGGQHHVIMSAGPGGSCNIAACDAHIVVFYTRSLCGEGPDFRLNGGNQTDIRGVMYMPCSEVHLGGASGSKVTGQVLAGEVEMFGGSDFTIDYHEYVTFPRPQVFMVE